MFPDIPEQALVAAPEFVQPQIGFDRGFCARNSHHASGTFMFARWPYQARSPMRDDMNITTYGVRSIPVRFREADTSPDSCGDHRVGGAHSVLHAV